MNYTCDGSCRTHWLKCSDPNNKDEDTILWNDNNSSLSPLFPTIYSQFSISFDSLCYYELDFRIIKTFLDSY